MSGRADKGLTDERRACSNKPHVSAAAMTGWLAANHAVLASIASLGTLFLWTIYLHVFMASFRRQRKPMLLISKGEAQDLSAHCLVTNMSREAVCIQSVVVDLWRGDERFRAYITEAEDIQSAGNPTGWQHLTRQGPLASETMTDMGTFGCILDYVVKEKTQGDPFATSEMAETATACDVTILGIYGSEDMLIGATRRFDLEGAGNAMVLRPHGVQTRQITSRRERRRLMRELAEAM